jgi:outer membrane receptor protein involved in Fe transport
VLRLRRSPTVATEAGAEVAYNWLEGESELIVGGAAAPVPGSRADVAEHRGEVYGSVVWQARSNLVLEGVLRFEASVLSARQARSEFQFFKPRGALTWSPTPARQVRLRLERQVGQLNFGDFLSSASLSTGFVTAGAAQLTPTQVVRAEASLEQRFWGDGVLELTARHEHLTDVIDRVPLVSPSGVFDARGNIGDGARQVLEINASAPLDRLGIPGGLVEVGANAQRSEVVDPTTGERREFSGQELLGWEARFIQDLPALRLSYGMSASGRGARVSYRFNGLETSEEEPNASAFVEYKPAGGYTLRGELNNLTARSSSNTRDAHVGFRDETPLNFVESRHDERYRTIRLSVSKILNAGQN